VVGGGGGEWAGGGRLGLVLGYNVIMYWVLGRSMRALGLGLGLQCDHVLGSGSKCFVCVKGSKII